jgi:hypothetical protein
MVFSALIACSGGETHDHDDLREDVLYCEEAVAALSECCPGFSQSGSLSCQYSYDYYPAQSCGGSSHTESTTPDLSLAESRCILALTCDALVAQRVCERTTWLPTKAVCP